MVSVALTMLMLLESRRRLPLVASCLLPILALFVVMWTDPATLQTPPQVSDLSDIQDGFGSGEVENDEVEAPSGGQGESGGEPETKDGEQPAGGDAAGGAKPDGPSGDQSGGTSGGNPEFDENGDPVTPSEDGEGEQPVEVEDGEPAERGDEDGDEPARPQDILDEDNDGGGSASPVAVVLLGDDYSPPSEGFYLRQEPMSQFNGVRIVAAENRDIDTDAMDHFPPAHTALTSPPDAHRVAIQGTVSLLTEHEAPFGIEAPVAFAPTRNPNPTRFVRTYRFESLAQSTSYAELLGHTAGSATWSDDLWDHYTEGPSDPRYEALARSIVADLPPDIADDPFAQALKVKLHLDENMRYSRKERHADVPDPTADFLFGNFIGYCVHSAHSAVYLWRSLGLPARIGTGYLVEESSRRGSALLVMNNAAHAWPELYLEDVGWVVLDVAPSENLDPPAEPVDEDMLSALADLAREPDSPQVRQPIDYAAAWDALLTFVRSVLIALSVLFVGGSYTIKLWRRLRPVFSSARAMPRVAYRASLDRLSEVGLIRKRGETRERFARRLAEVTPGFSAQTDDHIAAAMSDPSQPAPVGDWPAHRTTLRQDLRRTTPWWRRLLGLVNPISFFWSR